MKLFQCQNCGQRIYFENTLCESCGAALGFLPGAMTMSALKPKGDNRWRAMADRRGLWRYCENFTHGVCNWLVPADGAEPYCKACRLNRTIPDLSIAANAGLWQRIEQAKHRLIFELMTLGLPLVDRHQDPEHGLAFDFLTDGGAGSVLTGHDSGLITINAAEADDVERERVRSNMHENYRTMLGHFRHEIGHYYWDILVDNTVHTDDFRKLFGDERDDYGAALQRHYNEGPPAGWEQSWISAYATAHPWEDFAETWAHYMHMVDTLNTAGDWGVRLAPSKGRGRPRRYGPRAAGFDDMLEAFVPLTVALNSLNRSLGQRDAYPFVLNQTTTDKLRFVHGLIVNGAGGR